MAWWAAGMLALLAAVACGASAEEYLAANLPNHSTETAGGSTVVLTNPTATAKNVDVYDSGGLVTSLSVGPGSSTQYALSNRIDFTQKTTLGTYRFDADDGVLAQMYSPIASEIKNDATVLWDTTRLGTEHRSINLQPATCRETCRMFVTIVGLTPGTNVDVTPPVTTTAGGSVPAIAGGSTYSTTLGALEALHIEATGDMMNTLVASDQPVAVFSGASCNSLGAASCDQINEQIPPTAAGGKDFPICNAPSKWGAFMRVRMIAVEPGTTTVNRLGGGSYTLSGAGSVVHFDTTTHVHLQSDKRIHVGVFYSNGGSPTRGDPSWVWMQPAEMRMPSLTWYAADGSGAGRPSWGNHVAIAMPAGVSTTLDGTAVAGASGIPSSTWTCAMPNTSVGTHTVVAAGGSMPGALVQPFGFASPVTYGFMPTSGASIDLTHTINCDEVRTIFTGMPNGDFVRQATFVWSDGVTGTGTSHKRPYSNDTLTVDATAVDAFGVTHSVSRVIPSVSCIPPNDPPVVDVESVVFYACHTLSIPVTFSDPYGDPLVTGWRRGELPGSATFTGDVLRWNPYGTVGTYENIVFWADDGVYRTEKIITVQSLDCSTEPPPKNADSDGDGVPDQHDNCPYMANPDDQDRPRDEACVEEDAPAEPVPEPPAEPGPSEYNPCSGPVRAPAVANASVEDGRARIDWRYDDVCPVDHFRIWNGSDLVAIVDANGAGWYEAFDAAMWDGPRAYWIQAVREGEDFDAASSILTNRVRLDGCGIRDPVPCPIVEAIEPEQPAPAAQPEVSTRAALPTWALPAGSVVFMGALIAVVMFFVGRRSRD